MIMFFCSPGKCLNSTTLVYMPVWDGGGRSRGVAFIANATPCL